MVDKNGNPTLLVFFDQDGKGIISTLEGLGYSYDEGTAAWWDKNDELQYWFGRIVNGEKEDILGNEVATFGKGAKGVSTYAYISVKGYKSLKDVLAAQEVVIEDQYIDTASDVAYAVAYGPSMVEYLVLMTTSSNDPNIVNMVVFTKEAVEDGTFGEFFDADQWKKNTTISSFWKDLTGYTVGGYIASHK